MNLFWNSLTKRHQRALLLGGGAIAALLVVQFLALPLWETKRNTDLSIMSSEKTLAEMLLLDAEYRNIKMSSEKIQQALARRPRDFTLFSYMEKKAGDAGVKPNIKYINAAKGALFGPYEEMPVEIKLDKITLGQITDFLYLLESPENLIAVKRISISKMKESPEYLTTQIQAVTYQMAGADIR